VRSPSRRIGQRVLRQIRKEAQSLSHPAELCVLVPLRVQQVLLDHGADRIPSGVGGVVNSDLRSQRLCNEQRGHDESEMTSHDVSPAH
jgi:hypothetical protein